MIRFEPPPLPGEDRPAEPHNNPYASPAASGPVDHTQGYPTQPAPTQGHPAQGYPAQGYPAQGYGAAPQAPWGPAASYAHPRGTTVLVLGILSIVVAPVLGPFAWVMGRTALREVDAAPHATSNRSSLQVGMVLGIIGTGLMILGILAVLAFLMFATFTVSTG